MKKQKPVKSKAIETLQTIIAENAVLRRENEGLKKCLFQMQNAAIDLSKRLQDVVIDLEKQSREKFKRDENDWKYCHACQIMRGAVVPKGQNGITVSGGICGWCGNHGTLVPNVDYHWPKKDQKALFD